MASSHHISIQWDVVQHEICVLDLQGYPIRTISFLCSNYFKALLIENASTTQYKYTRSDQLVNVQGQLHSLNCTSQPSFEFKLFEATCCEMQPI